MASRQTRRNMGGDESPTQARAPIYKQIFLLLRKKIYDGEYVVGQYLPGERELCEMFGISRITAVRVLNELAASGFVVREQGRGTRVSFVARGMLVRGPAEYAQDVEPGPPTRSVSVQEFLTTMRRRSPEAGDVKLYSFGYNDASPSMADMLGISSGEQVQMATRVWRFSGRPYNHLSTMIPAEIANIWSADDLKKRPLSFLIEEAGIKIDRIDEIVSATLADETLAERLEVSSGSPLLRVIRLMRQHNGRIVEYVVGHYPPDRYQYRVTVTPHGVRKQSELQEASTERAI